MTIVRHFAILTAVLYLSILVHAQTPDPHQVPIMDGQAGPCSVSYTVTDSNGAPVYDARIKVHIEYGFGGFHRLDLEAATNVDGKTKFVGLPKKVKGGTLYFNAAKGDQTGSATYDPDKGCDGENDSIVLANR
jgi:hypothetical protein